ncbi:MAG: uncharacterized protein JWN13_6181 [Betaproteobacteria bacterium]|jgi:hypothetical protein|nr:uncharacterized protein [Betaproteobacteria bacterium]
MGKVEQLEQQIQNLSKEELAQFRAWFLEFDWENWDSQLERDVAAGKLDALGEKALRDHASGKSTPL